VTITFTEVNGPLAIRNGVIQTPSDLTTTDAYVFDLPASVGFRFAAGSGTPAGLTEVLTFEGGFNIAAGQEIDGAGALTISTAASGDLTLDSANDVVLPLADAAGARKLIVKDSGDNTKFTVSSVGDVLVARNLTVQGTMFTTHTEEVVVGDNYLYLNAGYTTDTAITSGLVVNYDPTTTQTTTTGAGVFTRGEDTAGGTGPTVTTEAGSGGTFSQGDIIQVSGSTSNDGIYEVQDGASTTLEIRGVDGTGTVEDFSQNNFTNETDTTATITKVAVSVMRAGTDGAWYVGNGSTTGFTYNALATSAGSTLDQAYTAGNVINMTNGRNIDFNAPGTGTAGITMDANAASNFTVDSANLVLSTTTSGELDLTSAGLMDINAGANLDIDVTGTYDMEASSTFSIQGTGASSITANSGNLAIGTATSGSLLLTTVGAGTFTVPDNTSEALKIAAASDATYWSFNTTNTSEAFTLHNSDILWNSDDEGNIGTATANRPTNIWATTLIKAGAGVEIHGTDHEVRTTDGTGAASSALTIRTGAPTGGDYNSGILTLDSGTPAGAGTAGAVNVAPTNATAVSVGNSDKLSTTTTLNGLAVLANSSTTSADLFTIAPDGTLTTGSAQTATAIKVAPTGTYGGTDPNSALFIGMDINLSGATFNDDGTGIGIYYNTGSSNPASFSPSDAFHVHGTLGGSAISTAFQGTNYVFAGVSGTPGVEFQSSLGVVEMKTDMKVFDDVSAYFGDNNEGRIYWDDTVGPGGGLWILNDSTTAGPPIYIHTADRTSGAASSNQVRIKTGDIGNSGTGDSALIQIHSGDVGTGGGDVGGVAIDVGAQGGAGAAGTIGIGANSTSYGAPAAINLGQAGMTTDTTGSSSWNLNKVNWTMPAGVAGAITFADTAGTILTLNTDTSGIPVKRMTFENDVFLAFGSAAGALISRISTAGPFGTDLFFFKSQEEGLAFDFGTADASSADTATGGFSISTGEATGTGATSGSGTLSLDTGDSTNGTTGNIEMDVGVGGVANGHIEIGVTNADYVALADEIRIGDAKVILEGDGLRLTASQNYAPVMGKMTETERDALTPVEGMIVYVTDLDAFYGYQNSAWVQLATGGSVTLDEAYNGGRTITVDAGAVEFDNRQTTGTVHDINVGGATTLTGDLAGIAIDLDTNVTLDGNSTIGIDITQKSGEVGIRLADNVSIQYGTTSFYTQFDGTNWQLQPSTAT